MQIPTKIIETPVGKQKVEIRDWITTRMRQKINDPLFASVETKSNIVGGKPDLQISKFDLKKFMAESQDKELEAFVVSIDGQKEIEVEGRFYKPWEYVLDFMHEDDGAFIKEQIDAKKNDKTAKS